MATPPKALEGIKIAAIGTLVTVPLTARHFALHGATVVRVESHVRLDGLRTQRPFPGGKVLLDHGVWFANINSGALDLCVDWTKPSGKGIVDRLARWADVILENFSPGVLDRFGWDYATLSKERPELIYMSSGIMGKGGSWQSLIGLGTAGAAIAGITHMTGWPGGEPTPVMTQYTDFTNPRLGVAALLGALEYRRRTGKGQYLDQSQVEGGIQLISPILMDWLNNQQSAQRTGNWTPEAAPHNTYPCQVDKTLRGDDRWVAIAALNDRHWQGLRRALGNPSWAHEERFATLLGRQRHLKELDALLAQWTRQRTPEEVEALLQREGVPASVVEDSRTTREDVQLDHRGFFRTLRHSVLGEHTYRGPSFRLSRTPDVHRAGPALGEHNVQVCRMLGMKDEEVWTAMEEGALATQPSVPVSGEVEGDSYSDTLPFLEDRRRQAQALPTVMVEGRRSER
ncbi:MAG: CoA transferase [Chloroflexi bacterium]|nr:CoA transferase [Chloroflexota bacterium]